MSELANGGIRCDGCGKLSRNPLGEYFVAGGAAQIGRAAYILPDVFFGLADKSRDYCEECGLAAAQQETKILN